MNCIFKYYFTMSSIYVYYVYLAYLIYVHHVLTNIIFFEWVDVLVSLNVISDIVITSQETFFVLSEYLKKHFCSF